MMLGHLGFSSWCYGVCTRSSCCTVLTKVKLCKYQTIEIDVCHLFETGVWVDSSQCSAFY